MPDCLILVERGGARNMDIVAMEFKKAIVTALKKIRSSYPGAIENFCSPSKQQSEASTKKLFELSELELSLTSIVLGTSLALAGVDFAIYDDEDIIDKYHEQLEAHINSSVKYVCISTTYMTDIKVLKKIIRFFKDRNCAIKIVIGGQVLLVWGENDVEELDDVFCYCYGDMDHLFGKIIVDLLSARDPGEFLTRTSRNGKSFYVAKHYTHDLDTTCLPDWRLLNRVNINNYYYSDNKWDSRVHVEERRGCPNRCAFCSYSTLNKHRQKSPERILQELISLNKLGYKKVYFIGSEFLMPISKSRETLKLIIKNKLDLDILCYARIDVLHKNPDVLDLMTEAGVTCVYFGVESGDQTILKNMNKNYNLETIPEVVSRLKERDIDIWASFIFGFPGETAKTIANTSDFIIRSNFTTLDFHALQVVPGTPLYINRDKYNLKLLGNYWFHPTMSLQDIPVIVKKVFTDIYPRCDSVICNINDHLGKYIPQKKFSEESLRKIDKCLHRMIYVELSDAIKDKAGHHLKTWNEMKQYIEYIPGFLL